MITTFSTSYKQKLRGKINVRGKTRVRTLLTSYKQNYGEDQDRNLRLRVVKINVRIRIGIATFSTTYKQK